MIVCDKGHFVITECKTGVDVIADMTCVIRGCVEVLLKNGMPREDIPTVLADCNTTALRLITEGEQRR